MTGIDAMLQTPEIDSIYAPALRTPENQKRPEWSGTTPMDAGELKRILLEIRALGVIVLSKLNVKEKKKRVRGPSGHVALFPSENPSGEAFSLQKKDASQKRERGAGARLALHD